jgi:hypothetical protein
MQYNKDEGRPSPEDEHKLFSDLVARYAADPSTAHSADINYAKDIPSMHIKAENERDIWEMTNALNLHNVRIGITRTLIHPWTLIRYTFTLTQDPAPSMGNTFPFTPAYNLPVEDTSPMTPDKFVLVDRVPTAPGGAD